MNISIASSTSSKKARASRRHRILKGIPPRSPIPAVSGVIVNGNKVLLVKRSHPPSMGQWSLPGGAVRLGEECGQALVREVREETGLSVRVGALLSAMPCIVKEDSNRILYHYIILAYRCHVLSGTVEAGSDAAEARWMTLGDVPSLGGTDGLMRIIEQGMGV